MLLRFNNNIASIIIVITTIMIMIIIMSCVTILFIYKACMSEKNSNMPSAADIIQ